jgi:hypothetical protein
MGNPFSAQCQYCLHTFEPLEVVERDRGYCSCCNNYLESFSKPDFTNVESFSDRDFTPLDPVGLRSAFAGTFHRVQSQRPFTLLSRQQESPDGLGSFWSTEPFTVRNQRLDFAITKNFQQRLDMKLLLAVPSDIDLLLGVVAPQTCNELGFLPGGADQVYLHREVVERLWQPSCDLLNALKSGKVMSKVINGWYRACRPAVELQKKHAAEFQLQRHTMYFDQNAADMNSTLQGPGVDDAQLRAAHAFVRECNTIASRLTPNQIQHLNEIRLSCDRVQQQHKTKQEVFDVTKTIGQWMEQPSIRDIEVIQKRLESLKMTDFETLASPEDCAALDLMARAFFMFRDLILADLRMKIQLPDDTPCAVVLEIASVSENPLQGNSLPAEIKDFLAAAGKERRTDLELGEEWLDSPIVVHETDDVIITILIQLDDVQTHRQGNTIVTTYYYSITVDVRRK